MPRETAERLEARFRDGIAFANAPVGAIAIYSEDLGFWSSVHGVEPGGSTRFALASITKMVTASVIYQLASEGRVSLTDTIDRWFPGLPSSDAITIDHLLSHTSGLMDLEVGETPNLVRSFEWPSEEWSQLAGGNNFCPGERFQYSNHGYVLLARIAEEVDGTEFADIVDRRVAKPLGLTTFGMLRPGGEGVVVAAGQPTVVVWRDLAGREHEAPYLSLLSENRGDGGAFGEIGDVLVFLDAWLNGDLFPLANRDLALSRMLPWAAPVSYGRGVTMWEVPGDAGALWLGHGGDMPGASTIAIYDATRNVWLAAAFNIQGVPTTAVANEMLRALER